MKTDIRYKELVVKPIEKAVITSGANVKIMGFDICNDGVAIETGSHTRFVMNKQEFAEFTSLISVINKQVNP